jgi:hypothetical protein
LRGLIGYCAGREMKAKELRAELFQILGFVEE